MIPGKASVAFKPNLPIDLAKALSVSAHIMAKKLVRV